MLACVRIFLVPNVDFIIYYLSHCFWMGKHSIYRIQNTYIIIIFFCFFFRFVPFGTNTHTHSHSHKMFIWNIAFCVNEKLNVNQYYKRNIPAWSKIMTPYLHLKNFQLLHTQTHAHLNTTCIYCTNRVHCQQKKAEKISFESFKFHFDDDNLK